MIKIRYKQNKYYPVYNLNFGYECIFKLIHRYRVIGPRGTETTEVLF